DVPGAGDTHEGLYHVLDHLVLDHDLDPDFGHEIDHIGRSAVDLLLASGAAEALHLGDRHALDPDLTQAVLHVVELEWLDDRFDFFHVAPIAKTSLLMFLRHFVDVNFWFNYPVFVGRNRPSTQGRSGANQR